MFASMLFQRGAGLSVRLVSLPLAMAHRFQLRAALRVFPAVRGFDVEPCGTRNLGLQFFALFAEQAGPL